ncbi:MAG: alanine racemase C-terminal domain-containing protein [Protaetiibacter sp.]
MRRRAVIDLDALAANLRDSGAQFDARADGYGHGLDLVGPVAREFGADVILVSGEHDAQRAHALGFREVRVGGLPPDAPASSAAPYGLDGRGRPVMTLSGELIAVKRVPAGAGVSYGYTHRTSAATTLGLVGLGYADGIPRLASNRAELAIEGRRVRLVGRVAMDQLVVDLGSDEVPAGAEVVVFGDPATGAPAATEWARWTEREALALTAGLGGRIRREAR